MKLFKCCTKGKWQLYPIGILLLPMFIAACGGSLGKIQPGNVDTVITQSETAINQARLANAESLAPETLQKAEDALKKAKEAAQAKEGLEAIRSAYDALTQAQIAEQEAMYKSQEGGMNAIIQRKEAEISETRANLQTTEGELEKVRAEIQQLDMQKEQLKTEMDQKIQALERDRQNALRDSSKAQTELQNLQSELKAKTDAINTQNQTKEEYERQVNQLRRELALAQSMADEARKEAGKAQERAKAQAQAYSKQIERLNQVNASWEREERLKRKAEEARAYVQQQRESNTLRTGQTSLTSQEISKGRSVINDWYLAWISKNVDQHLINYAPDVVVDQVVVHAGDEKQTYLNREQMTTALSKMIDEPWAKTARDPEIDADGNSVIGTYRFIRLSQNDGSKSKPALYDIWTREVWVHEENNTWKIYREVWRIYEDVPKFQVGG